MHHSRPLFPENHRLRVSRNASTNLVTSTSLIAFRERDTPADLTFHSDRGKQYVLPPHLQRSCKVRCEAIVFRYGTSHNAVAEAFFASFKREEAYRREYTSEQSFRKSVEQYVQFYNEVRPHRTLRYKTRKPLKPLITEFVRKPCSNNDLA